MSRPASRPADQDRHPVGEREQILRLDAYAKVNLSLEVRGRLADGYHAIVSVAQTISLYDTLEVTSAADFTVRTEPALVDESENLARRAGEALALASGREPSGHLLIRKQIPIAAGLGGGSSDAASTLRLLNRLWGTRLSPRRLVTIGVGLGSDILLFQVGGTTLVSARGNAVQTLPPVRPFWLVLVCPGTTLTNKTRALYQALRPEEWTNGDKTLALAGRVRAGELLDDQLFVNGFDAAADRIYPGFPELRAQLAEVAGVRFHVTGAGPTLFAIFEDAPKAHAAADRLRRSALAVLPILVAQSVAQRASIRAGRAAHRGPDPVVS